MSLFEIREPTAADLPAMARGFVAAGGGADPARQAARFEAAFFANPAGSSGLVAVNAKGELVGHFGVSHVPVTLEGAPKTFGRLMGCFIAEAYRVGGVHSLLHELQEVFAERHESSDRLALIYGLFEESDWWFLRHLCRFTSIGTGVRFRRPILPWPAGATSDLRVIDGLAEPAVDSAIVSGACATRHDAAWRRWRTRPAFGSPAAFSVVRDDQIVGWSTADDRGETRVLLDWAVADGDAQVALALLHAVCEGGRRAVAAPFWNPSIWTSHVFQEAGFHMVAEDLPYLAARVVQRNLKRHWLSVNWQVTAADIGLRRQPKLGVDEEVTRPPQPGTTGSRAPTPGSSADAE